MADNMIQVDVVYALARQQDIKSIRIPAGSTVRDAILASGLPEIYPEIDLTRNKLGIYAKLAKADAVLRDRDRVEIYRPLIADPKEVRKQRAAEGKIMKKGTGEGEDA